MHDVTEKMVKFAFDKSCMELGVLSHKRRMWY